VIAAAPWSFGLAVLAGIAIIAGFFRWAYGRVLAHREGEIKVLERQLADYKDKLSGALPDEAKTRIEALEQRLEAIAPMRLTPDEKQALATNATLPQGIEYKIGVYNDPHSEDYADDIGQALSMAGWKVRRDAMIGIGIFRSAHSLTIGYPTHRQEFNLPPDAAKLASALDASGLVYGWVDGHNPPELALFVTRRRVT
jgi:hypothetical protein